MGTDTPKHWMTFSLNDALSAPWRILKLVLRSRRPATGVSRALRPKCPRECLSPECQKGVPDTPGTLSGHFLNTPEPGARRVLLSCLFWQFFRYFGVDPKSQFSLLFRYFDLFLASGSVGPSASHSTSYREREMGGGAGALKEQRRHRAEKASCGEGSVRRSGRPKHENGQRYFIENSE